MSSNKIESARDALSNGESYTLRADSKGDLPVLLAALLSEGKPGEHLIRDGYSPLAHMEMVIDYIKRKLAKGEDEKSIAKNLLKSAACNTSQFRQALPKLLITLEIDGEDEEVSFGSIHPASDETRSADSSAADC